MSNAIQRWSKFIRLFLRILANNVVNPLTAKLQREKVIAGVLKSPKETPPASKEHIASAEVAYQSFRLRLAKYLFNVDIMIF